MEEYVEHQLRSKIETFFRGFFKVVFMIIAAIVFVLLFGYGFMLLWNWLMPDVFGLPILSYWKAVGILVMAKLLFGGLGDGPPRTGHKKHLRKSKRSFKQKMTDHCKKDFSEWEFYDEFWKEEGEKAFNEYVKEKQTKNQ